MHGLNQARDLIANNTLSKIGLMNNSNERFRPDQMDAAIRRASDSDSLKVIINWD